jgi:phage N-6-adenine-methyltransferase
LITALARIDTAMRALEEATDVRDVVRIRNEATVLKVLVEKARMGFEAILRTCELEVRAARRAGALLITLEESGGRNGRGGKGTAATLADLNVEKWESYRWQEIARIPDDLLDAYIERQRQERKRVTVAGFTAFSSESKEWYTPQKVIDATLAVLNQIDLDPCAETVPYSRLYNIPASRHYTKVDDGLSKEWIGTVYMNPPYGDEIPLWVAKLVEQHEQWGRVTQAIMLVPARTDTVWFRMLRDYPVCFVTGRLNFRTPADREQGPGQSSPFPSAIFALGVPRKLFLQVFGQLGDVYERVRR